MAIRVTQNTMYNNMVGHMQSNLGAYMESIQQGSSQKKINRPSDDPAGTYRVLTTRNDMVATEQYQENVDTAKGWLNLADSVLSTNVTTAITGLKALAEQASTGTYDAGQRLMMADQARQYFGQLLNLSNTQFEDMHLFAGHKYDQPAFQQGLAITSWDEGWKDAVETGAGIKIDGASERTVLVQFETDFEFSETPVNADGDPITDPENANWNIIRWSNDGGQTWQSGSISVVDSDKDEEGNLTVNTYRLTMGGVSMDVPAGLEVTNPDYDPDKGAVDGNTEKVTLSVKGMNGEDKDFGANNGTALYIRPTAYYQGDDKDPAIDVTLIGAGNFTNVRGDNVNADDNPVQAKGTFGTNVLVRVDGAQDGTSNTWNQPINLVGPNQEFMWSYSTDGGNTWVTAKGTTNGSGAVRLPVPGGYVDIDGNKVGGDYTIPKGMQINIHPSRADLEYEIMKDTYLSVNSVGKDVFGGYYEGKPAMSDQDNNLFEVVGSFIGYLEGNNQEGCQRTLAALEKAEKTILAEATRIGGMENRLEMAADVLSFQKLDQQERLSYVEDIDLTELLTKLTRQQITYQTVLQSSSMIMQMSLLNYV